MPGTEVDVVVIGMGPGGEDLGARLAKAGLSVVGVDARLVGGECPYYACVPTKMMIRAADSLGEAHRVDSLAGAATTTPDWSPVARRIRDEATDNWDDTVAVDRFVAAGGHFVRGRGQITAPHEVTVSTSEGPVVFRTRKGIVLNTGTDPAVPSTDGLAETPYWTNRDAVAIERLPSSLVVLGGGPVGCEFAQLFARFGVAVTVVQRSERLLPADEPEAGELLGDVFAQEGISVRTGLSAARVRYEAGAFSVKLDNGETITAERLLVAAGRHTDMAALGVGAVGLPEDARGVEVDERMRAADGLWAIGDITGRGAFTHMSMYQARIAAEDILGDGGEVADYRAVPRVTFTDPEVGSVGLTEQAARDAGLTVRVGSALIPDSARGFIHKVGNRGFVKVVEDAERGVLVGATSVGPNGGEVLGALVVAVHGAVPVSSLRSMIYAYPTFHRAIESALADLA